MLSRFKVPLPSAVSFVIWCLFMHQLATQSFVFGSLRGNWDYRYWTTGSNSLYLVAVSISAALASLYWFSERSAGRSRSVVIAVWSLVGVALPLAGLAFAPTTLARIIQGDRCTAFYNAARMYPPLELLANFTTLASTLPIHAATNMPGKTLEYAAILRFTDDPMQVGVITLALAALGGLLVYGVARRWFRDRRAALLALALFTVLPARVNFALLPNCISAGLVLLPLYLLLIYIDTRRDWLLPLLGTSVYLLFVFEPLPLALGPLFVGVVAQRWFEGQIAPRAAWKLVVLPLLAFALTFGLFKLCFRFDAFHAFDYLYQDAVDFNQRAYRPYLRWAGTNLIEFGVGLGVFNAAVSVLALLHFGRVFWVDSRSEGFAEAIRRLLLSRTGNMLVMCIATLVVLDLWNVNRGEVTRLWIFLSVAMQLAAAGYCCEHRGDATARLMVATAALQSVVSTATVAFSPC
ncbi:MAG TPA: hypothetical protein VJV78_34205 [Polyangiales bacterium]|nr:hypothetical protein [Polyangiales bacterium]